MMELSDQIDQAKASAQRSSAWLLKTLEATPDDRLGWSPSETSRHSLWIAGHCGTANQAFAKGIRGEDFPPMSVAEFEEMVWNAGRETSSREEALRWIQESTDEVMAALDALTPERMAAPVQTPFGPLPMVLWMTIPGDHMAGHAHQLAYLQTVWGDRQNHMM